ncbi:hypothetical protein MUK42_13147 [Musa troglodytarum]|uniref:Uncharacterized protein n=1 Tax=Musa troglodytarum TaxID=320322 RepID=A0A9E7HW15_9LILI|nr:hypothetical protein MUK42_13147 [Musa troglodytarum]
MYSGLNSSDDDDVGGFSFLATLRLEGELSSGLNSSDGVLYNLYAISSKSTNHINMNFNTNKC